MRSLMCVLLLLIFCSRQGTSEHQAVGPIPESCCWNFIDFQIPASKIVSAEKTSSRCPALGIVVTTPRTKFCVRPDEEWIKSFMEKSQWK
ncbi:C-C motif chemokine 4 homolog [Carassius gibelio]|uniref:C-C motif chemokine 4 homolog n=1 Tax=Carassius gibelio TaxID=101364 RepID=UPI002279A202|nr:C-C motif chemokine 4 homolog [Carassius gibelio]